jgi:hypothetical protein
MKKGGSSESDFHKLLGRGLTDYEFRKQLADPAQQAQALESMDIEPTDEVLASLNAAIEAINNLAGSETLGPDSVQVA